MWASIIAVVGTLAGAVASGLLQHRAARAGRAEERQAERQQDEITAVTELATALSDHRRAMWLRKEAELTDAPQSITKALAEASHETRAEITSPLVRVRLLLSDQGVREAVEAATRATFTMRDACDLDDLQERRTAALTAHDAMVDTVSACLS